MEGRLKQRGERWGEYDKILNMSCGLLGGHMTHTRRRKAVILSGLLLLHEGVLRCSRCEATRAVPLSFNAGQDPVDDDRPRLVSHLVGDCRRLKRSHRGCTTAYDQHTQA